MVLKSGFNGQRHREDDLAVENSNGSKYWYLNGKCYREDGPAIECPNGSICWYDKCLATQQLLSEEMKIDYSELYNSYLVHQIMIVR